MTNPRSRLSVLFVCTGNICRSPTAEAVFRDKVRHTGLDSHFFVDSAGTHGYHVGEPPDPRSVATAMAKGVDMRSLRARRFEEGDFRRFDYILAMDAGHHGILERARREQAGGELSLFLEFPSLAEDGLRDMPDPYYGSQKDFDLVYDLVERGCDRLLAELRARHDL